MFKFFIKTAILCSLTYSSLNAQKVLYRNASFDYPVPPTKANLQAYKSFDFTFRNEMESFWGNDKKEEVKFNPSIREMQLVDNSTELHVVTTLYYLKGKKTDRGLAFAVDINTVIVNKYGTKLFEYRISDETAGASDGDKKRFIEQCIGQALKGYEGEVFGTKGELKAYLCSLEDVKKKSPLYPLLDQIKEIKGSLVEGPEAFVKAAQQYVPFWEKMLEFNEKDAEIDEVKRAAYQNLATYYICLKDFDKAKTYLEEYKKIDKEVKAMFGLERYKPSEESEKLIAGMTKQASNFDEKNPTTEALTKDVILDRLDYTSIEGTVTIKDKKKSGTYNGLIKVKNVLPAAFKSSNMLDLDARDIQMLIVAKNDKGTMDTISTYISKIENMKDNTGKEYIAQKLTYAVGVLAGGDMGTFALMTPTYSSAKVAVFRCVAPIGRTEDFIIRKTGDEKGLKNALLNNFKRMADYFSDCSEISDKVKSDAIDKKITPEKFAEMYSNCSIAK